VSQFSLDSPQFLLLLGNMLVKSLHLEIVGAKSAGILLLTLILPGLNEVLISLLDTNVFLLDFGEDKTVPFVHIINLKVTELSGQVSLLLLTVHEIEFTLGDTIHQILISELIKAILDFGQFDEVLLLVFSL